MFCPGSPAITSQNLPQGERTLFNTEDVGGNGWKNPAVLASLLWRGCLECMLASHSAQKKGHGRQSRQRTSAVFVQHCWQMWVSTFSCATVVLTRRGLSALQLSAKRLLRVLQFDEARREALGDGASTSSPVASLSECWRSRRNSSVKMVQNRSKVNVLYGVAVKGENLANLYSNTKT